MKVSRFSITKSTIDWSTHQQWKFWFFILLLAHCVGRCFMSNYVAWKSKKYEVIFSFTKSIFQVIRLWIIVYFLYRTIASVSVITVFTTCIFIWMNILEDDNNTSETFQGLRLGIQKWLFQCWQKRTFLAFYWKYFCNFRRTRLCNNVEGLWHYCFPIWHSSCVDDHRSGYAKEAWN